MLIITKVWWQGNMGFKVIRWLIDVRVSVRDRGLVIGKESIPTNTGVELEIRVHRSWS